MPGGVHAEVAQDGLRVRGVQQGGDVVHGRDEGIRERRSGDLAEEVAQERVRARELIRGELAGETLAGGRVEPGGEEAVGEGLGEHVREVVLQQRGDEHLPEAAQPRLEEAGGGVLVAEGFQG